MVAADHARLETLREEIMQAQNARKGSFSSSTSGTVEDNNVPSGSIHGSTSVSLSSSSSSAMMKNNSRNHASESIKIPSSVSISSTKARSTASSVPDNFPNASTIVPSNNLNNQHYANILFDISSPFPSSVPLTEDNTDRNFSAVTALVAVTRTGRKVSLRMNIDQNNSSNTISSTTSNNYGSSSIVASSSSSSMINQNTNIDRTFVHSIVQELMEDDNNMDTVVVPEHIDTVATSSLLYSSSSTSITPDSTVSYNSIRNSMDTPISSYQGSPSNAYSTTSKNNSSNRRVTKRLQFADAVIKSPLSTPTMVGGKNSTLSTSSSKPVKRKRTIQSLPLQTNEESFFSTPTASKMTKTTTVADNDTMYPSIMNNNSTDSQPNNKQRSFPFSPSISNGIIPTNNHDGTDETESDSDLSYPVPTFPSNMDETVISSTLWDNDNTQEIDETDENEGNDDEEEIYQQQRMYASYLTSSTPIQHDDTYYRSIRRSQTNQPMASSPFSSSTSQSRPYFYGRDNLNKPSLLRLHPVTAASTTGTATIVPPFTPMDNTNHRPTGLDSTSQGSTVSHMGPIFVYSDTKSTILPILSGKERTPTSVRLTQPSDRKIPSNTTTTVQARAQPGKSSQIASLTTISGSKLPRNTRWDINSPSASMTSAGFGFGVVPGTDTINPGIVSDHTLLSTTGTNVNQDTSVSSTVIISSSSNDSTNNIHTTNNTFRNDQSRPNSSRKVSEQITEITGSSRKLPVNISGSPTTTTTASQQPLPQIQPVLHHSVGSSFISPINYRSYSNNMLSSPISSHGVSVYPGHTGSTTAYVSTPLGIYHNNTKQTLFSPDHYQYSMPSNLPFHNNNSNNNNSNYYPNLITPTTRLSSSSPLAPSVGSTTAPNVYRTIGNVSTGGNTVLPSLPLHVLSNNENGYVHSVNVTNKNSGSSSSSIGGLKSMVNSSIEDSRNNSPYSNSNNPSIPVGSSGHSSASTFILPMDVPLVHSHRSTSSSNITTDNVSDTATHLSDFSFTSENKITPRTDN